ncbi:hypothetical protein GUJ93_ZPchr0003g18253 [Zizania palustris]|uniref:Uncharacterized protein n=1 Tax=Zizania palustris TaxID=103762 RepID=A0A8J5RM29_ZIZPA|nr:hypothetical protein GUJ93_ZPchr0003g18253 [Zizania palustris]
MDAAVVPDGRGRGREVDGCGAGKGGVGRGRGRAADGSTRWTAGTVVGGRMRGAMRQNELAREVKRRVDGLHETTGSGRG